MTDFSSQQSVAASQNANLGSVSVIRFMRGSTNDLAHSFVEPFGVELDDEEMLTPENIIGMLLIKNRIRTTAGCHLAHPILFMPLNSHALVRRALQASMQTFRGKQLGSTIVG